MSVKSMRGMDWREWPGLYAVLKQYALLPLLETEFWARWTLLRSTWVLLLFPDLQKVLKFIVSKDNKLWFQDRASAIYSTVHRCVTGQKDSSLPGKVNGYSEKTKHWKKVLLEKNISRQIWQLKRNEAAAAAPHPQVQPVARLKMFSQ